MAYEPAGTTLLPLIERLGRELGDWQGLLDVYAQVGRGRPDAQDRVDLLRRRAAILEHNMNDPAGAFAEHVYAFVLDQESETSYREILRLAEVTGRWEDALSIEAQLYARATDRTAKTEIARRAAALIEVKIGDNIRAFRAYLGAFQLAPDDQRTADALWRLAEKIGPYPLAAAPALTPQPAAAEERVATEDTSAAEPAPTGPVGAPPAGEVSHDIITGEIDIAEVDILEETPQPIPSPLVPIVTTDIRHSLARVGARLRAATRGSDHAPRLPDQDRRYLDARSPRRGPRAGSARAGLRAQPGRRQDLCGDGAPGPKREPMADGSAASMRALPSADRATIPCASICAWPRSANS